MAVNTIGVIGAGTMGTGIAQVAAQAGLAVALLDVSAEAIAASRRRLDRSLQGGIEREKITVEQADALKQRIT